MRRVPTEILSHRQTSCVTAARIDTYTGMHDCTILQMHCITKESRYKSSVCQGIDEIASLIACQLYLSFLRLPGGAPGVSVSLF